jgi:N-acetyl-anhydromuramyl-L-alanine amidase AmpD
MQHRTERPRIPVEQETTQAWIDQWFGIEDFKKKAKLQACSQQRGYSCRKGARQLDSVDSIVLHQTSGSNSTNANVFLSIPAHYVVLSNGRVLQLYPETDYIQHANTFNSWSVGIEFAGTFANDNSQCWWDSKTKYVKKGFKKGARICAEPTAEQIMAGRNLVLAIALKVPTIRYILAHRQAASSRSNDPGPSIWLGVAEWAKKQLDLVPADTYTEGSGKPIPASWRSAPV